MAFRIGDAITRVSGKVAVRAARARKPVGQPCRWMR